MTKITKKTIAFIVCMMMCLNLVVPVFAENQDGVTFVATVDKPELQVSDQDQTVVMTVTASDSVTVDGISFKTKWEEPLTIAGISGGEKLGKYDSAGTNLSNGIGYWKSETSENVEDVTTLAVITFTIPANTPAGTYELGVTNLELTKDYGDIWESGATATVTLTISEPAAPAAPYEIYYELNSDVDADSDKYADLDVKVQAQQSVTAEIFLVSNEKNVTVQAYDIYLTYDSNLTYVSSDLTGTPFVESGVLKHIQLVKDAAKYISLTKGTPVKLGTVTFSIDDTAKYGDLMELALVQAADETNSADTKEVTNISIGEELSDGQVANGEGDATSYYPANTSIFQGVEITTTYTVTYADGVDNEVIAVPSEQVKEYNKSLPLSATVPMRTGYLFDGWLGDDGETYAAGDTYEGNADLELTAQWKKNTFTITFVNDDGTSVLQFGEWEYGTTPVYSGETPTKASTDQYTYTFAGWNPTIVAVTGDATYTATYTTTVNKYNVTWLNQDGTPIKTNEGVNYNTALSEIAPAAPSKAADDTYTYTFAGWATSAGQETGTPASDLGSVEGNATYYAAFSKEFIDYTVTFTNGDNSTTSVTKHYGDTVTLPAETEKAGYEFKGWSNGTEIVGNAGESYTVNGNAVLTAEYAPISYKITLNVNGGDALTSNELTYNITETVTLPTATKTGATFGGWKLETAEGNWEANTYAAGAYSGKYGTITLVAQWTNDAYSISKGSMTGGDVTPSKTTANYGEEITLTNTPEAGYKFVSYTVKDASGNSVPVSEGKFTMPASNVTVSATFELINYNITEAGNMEHGSVRPSSSTATMGSTVTLTVTPAEGYEIQSVSYTTESGSAVVVNPVNGAYTFEMPASDVTVSAEFKATTYTITYVTNGGSAIEGGTYTVEDTVTLPTSSTRTGYTFGGWSVNEDLSGEEVTQIAKGSTGDKTFYAIWDPNTDTPYKVYHYQQNVGAEANNYETGYTLKDTEDLTGTTDTEVEPAVKSYDGFTAPEKQKVTIKADGTTEVKYYYTRDTYTITYDVAGGSEVENGSYVYGVGVTELPTPTKNGYTFSGWTVDGTLINSITAEDFGNKTLVAQWNAENYTLTLKPAGGALPDGFDAVYTIEDSVVLPTPTRAGYIFGGWKVEEAVGSWTKSLYKAGSYSQQYGDVTLEAQWKRAVTVVVEDYKYSLNTGYRLLLVDATGMAAGDVYKFDGETMYYTDDVNYRIDKTNDTGVFYLLIAETNLVKNGEIYTNELTEEAYGKLTVAAETRKELVYNGDINGDGVVNIADANVVYQMTQHGGSYYSMEQLDCEQRLLADMSKATVKADGNVAEHRGSIEDVDAIITLINGTTNP